MITGKTRAGWFRSQEGHREYQTGLFMRLGYSAREAETWREGCVQFRLNAIQVAQRLEAAGYPKRPPRWDEDMQAWISTDTRSYKRRRESDSTRD